MKIMAKRKQNAVTWFSCQGNTTKLINSNHLYNNEIHFKQRIIEIYYIRYNTKSALSPHKISYSTLMLHQYYIKFVLII